MSLHWTEKVIFNLFLNQTHLLFDFACHMKLNLNNTRKRPLLGMGGVNTGHSVSIEIIVFFVTILSYIVYKILIIKCVK